MVIVSEITEKECVKDR